jgi:FtsP/CotA-like multicopper oxidase with cupredoxin domain
MRAFALSLLVFGSACALDDVEEGAGTLTACPSTNVIDEPPQFAWTYHPASADNPEPYYSGVLEYGEATFTIGDDTLTTRAYRQAGGEFAIPGPTITMVPGNTYVLRYHNLLPYEPASPIHNEFKDPNVSNLHTHGLHISGESPSDDVTRFFEGQRGGDFVYQIPADHMGGTYWYHAHHHGSTFLQVSSGAFGQIIIDDAGDGIPPNVAAMPERQLSIAYLDPSVAGTGGDTLISGTLEPTWTVNGKVQGNLCMVAGEWQHWRILLADRIATEKTVAVGANCEVALLARDGVWRTTAPRVLATRFVRMTGASRADLAVRCSNDSVITVNNNPIANVLVDGTGDTTVGPYSDGATGTEWSAIRPSYLRDLRGETNVNTETVGMSARTINSVRFDADVPTFTLPADQVQHWTLNGANVHPFHLHVYHVQAQDCSTTYEAGEFYDTVASACSVRFDLNAATSTVYEGRTILHCHILDHEDLGAMGWADVVGGLPPPAFPDDGELISPYAESYARDSADWCLGDEPCDDGDLCNGGETCDAETGTCGAGAPLDCDDGKPCTVDSCDPELGCVHTPTCPITLATEDFESGTWSGGTLWLDEAWTVRGDAVVVGTEAPHAGSWHARLRRGNGKIVRRFRRKNASDIHLRFWARVSSFEEADAAAVQVGTTGGLVTVMTFTAADSDDQYRFYDLDLSALPLGNTIRVVFDANMNAVNDLWYIDDIEISGLR